MARATPKDIRSTGRRRAQAVLKKIGRPYWCGSTQDGGVTTYKVRDQIVGCGRSPSDDGAPGGVYAGMGTLQVNHINKDLLDVDPVNLQYLCASCHKLADSVTQKGESTIEDEFGYGPVL